MAKRSPENYSYVGYLYRDGKFVGHCEEKGKPGSGRQFRSLETLLAALAEGFPGRLILECEMDCPEGVVLLSAAWRDYPYEPLQLSEAAYRLPWRLKSRLLRLQRRSLSRELAP